MVSSDYWTEDVARRYDDASSDMFSREVLDPTVDFLAELAGDGAALEFAIGTGRVAVPLAARGVPVSGIELSQPMVDRLRTKMDAASLPVVVGDMSTSTVEGEFSLVYLVFNTIGNLREQEEQVACFRNAARHLAPGGRFVIELWIPGIRRLPPGQTAVPFAVDDDHLGFDTYDMATQQGASHHYSRQDDGTFRYGVTNFRYIWPAECDLMAQLAGLEFEARYADWHRTPFTGESESHVSVWRKPLPAEAARAAN
ncbi:class I SAM-dependent methyltransferase [Microbacterium sp.]|uniref:class I SAM-dependent methyltransferase n=1 Tax=Microbacterium sp. TaxID=51671 RepID=UPI003F6EA493